MIFHRKHSIFVSIILCLSILLIGCGGGTQDVFSSTTFNASAPSHPAPDSLTLILNGPRNNYSLINSGDEFVVTDKVGNEGTTSVRGKTSIKFTDVSINLLVEKKSKTIAEKDLNTLVELYVAFFNRVPDADGMSYWIDQIKAGMTVDQLANNFYNAAIQFTEVTHYSATMTSADFVKIIYKNVLGRTGETAPSNEEVNYWASELDSGRSSKGRLVVTMLNSARTFVGDAKWGWVPQLLDNKVNVGKFFAVEQGLNFNTPQESITQGVTIAAAISPTDVSKAKEQIPAPDKNFSLGKSIVSVALTPNYTTIDQGITQSYQLMGIYSDGSTQALSTSNWNSSNPSVANISASGVAKGIAPGVTNISTIFGSKSASASLVVSAIKTVATINSIKLSTLYQNSFPVGVSQSLTATAVMSDGFDQEITKTAVWTSSNTAVATVNAGVVNPVSAGNAKISATSGGQTASYNFVVNTATPTSLSIGGPNAGAISIQPNDFAQGSSVGLRLGAFFSDGSYFTSVTGSWASSDTSKIAINNAGIFSAIAPGTVKLSASFGGLTATRNITIATPLSTPLISLTCNVTTPVSISAATWNAAYTSDPSNLTKWLDVDWTSCNSRVTVKLVDVKSNYKLFEAATSTNGVFYPGEVFSTGRTPQLTAGDIIRVGYSNSLGALYYTLYTITVKP